MRRMHGRHVSALSLGCGLVPVEQAIDKRAERGLRMAAVRIIEVETGARQRPAREGALEPSARERFADGTGAGGVENPKARQARPDPPSLGLGHYAPLH